MNARGFLLLTQRFLVLHQENKALGGDRQDFRADALRHGQLCEKPTRPCFGARSAPHSRVVADPPSRLSGAAPHLPTPAGRWRGLVALVPGRPAEKPNTDRAVPVPTLMRSYASAATVVSSHTIHSD